MGYLPPLPPRSFTPQRITPNPRPPRGGSAIVRPGQPARLGPCAYCGSEVYRQSGRPGRCESCGAPWRPAAKLPTLGDEWDARAGCAVVRDMLRPGGLLDPRGRPPRIVER